MNIPGRRTPPKPAANQASNQKQAPARGRINYNSQPKPGTTTNTQPAQKSLFDLTNTSKQVLAAGKKQKDTKNTPTSIIPNKTVGANNATSALGLPNVLDKSAFGGPRFAVPPVISNRLDTSVTTKVDLPNNIGQLSLQGSGILLDALDGRGISMFRPEIISSFDFLPAFIDKDSTVVKQMIDLIHDSQVLRDENVKDILSSMTDNETTRTYLNQIIFDYEENVKKAKDDLSFLNSINQKLEMFKKALNIKNFIESEIGTLSSFIQIDKTRRIHSYTPMEFIKNYLFIDQQEFQKLSSTAIYNQLCYDFKNISSCPVAYRNSRELSERNITSSTKLDESSKPASQDFQLDIFARDSSIEVSNILEQARVARLAYSELSQQEVRSAAGRQLAARTNIFDNLFYNIGRRLDVLDVNHITKFSLFCYLFANELSVSSTMGETHIQELLKTRFNLQTYNGYNLFDQIVGVPGADIFSPNVSSAQASCLSFSKIESNTFTVLPFEQVLLKYKGKGYIPGTRQYVENILSDFNLGVSNVNSLVTTIDNTVNALDEVGDKVFSFSTTDNSVVPDEIVTDILTFISDTIPAQSDTEKITSFVQEAGMLKIPAIDSTREVHLFKLCILAAFYQTSVDSSPPPILRELLSQFSANDLNLAEYDVNSSEFTNSKAINFSQLPTIVRAIIRTINDISVFSEAGRSYRQGKSELQQDGGVGLQCLFDQYNPVINAIQSNNSLFGFMTKVLKQIPDDVQERAILLGKTRQSGLDVYSLLLMLFKSFMEFAQLIPDLTLTLSRVTSLKGSSEVTAAENAFENARADFSSRDNSADAEIETSHNLFVAEQALQDARAARDLAIVNGENLPTTSIIPIDGITWYTISFNSGILKDSIIDATSAITNASSQTSTQFGSLLMLAYRLASNADSITIQHFTLINSVLKNIRDKGKELLSFFNNKETKDRLDSISISFTIDKSYLISKEYLIQCARALDELSPKINKIKDLIINLSSTQDAQSSTSTFLDDSVVSDLVFDNLNSLLASAPLAKQQASNGKILTVGIPVGLTRHIKEHPRSINDNAPIDNFIAKSQIDLINVCVYKRDLEFDSIVFEPMKFTFEMSRFLDNASLATVKEAYTTLTDTIQEVKTNIITTSAADASNRLGAELDKLYGNNRFGKMPNFPRNNPTAQRGNNDIVSQDETIFLPNSANTVDYVTVNEKYIQSVSELISNVDYTLLSHDQIRGMISNHYKSYLLSTFIRMLTGVDLRDATFTLNDNLDDSNEKQRFQELVNQYVANLYNVNLSRDERAKALIRTATDSSLVDIVTIAEEIASKTNLGNSAAVSLKQDVTTMLRLFNANSILTPSSSVIKKIFAPKLFERVFNIYVDPDEFKIDIEKTTRDPINDAGKFMYDMIKANNASANNTGVAIHETYDENNALISAKLVKPAGERVEMADYFVTIESII